MFYVVNSAKRGRSRCRSGNGGGRAARHGAYCRRLRCEPLEERQLLSVGVSGVVWNDLNQDGIRGIDEPGVAGAAVQIDLIGDVTLEVATITDADGGYAFNNLPEALYREVFRAPVGYTFTAQDAGGDDTLDSDADSSGVTSDFMAYDGQSYTGHDAGLVGVAPNFGFALGMRNGDITDSNGPIIRRASGKTWPVGPIIPLVANIPKVMPIGWVNEGPSAHKPP
jgi:hypothetical protein